MTTEIKDKLAERIAKRRAEMGEQPATERGGDIAFVVVGAPEISAAIEPQPPNPDIGLVITRALDAMEAGQNPMVVARLLGEVVGRGVKNKDLAAALAKSEPWVSKRLGLLSAPVAVQRLIESGELAESEYHNNRKNIKTGIKTSAGALKYQRMPTITISIASARSLAAILRVLAQKTGAAPIVLEADASKKEITSILNFRAGEIFGLLD
jgi:hypothetical protein